MFSNKNSFQTPFQTRTQKATPSNKPLLRTKRELEQQDIFTLVCQKHLTTGEYLRKKHYQFGEKWSNYTKKHRGLEMVIEQERLFGVLEILKGLEKLQDINKEAVIRMPPEEFEALCNSEDVKRTIELEQKAKEFCEKLKKRFKKDEEVVSFCESFSKRRLEGLARLAANRNQDEELGEEEKLAKEFCFLREELRKMVRKVSDQYEHILNNTLEATILKAEDIFKEYHTMLDEAYSQLPLEELEILCNSEDAKLIIEIEQRIEDLGKIKPIEDLPKIKSIDDLTDEEDLKIFEELVILKKKAIEPIIRFKEDLQKRLKETATNKNESV